LTEIKVADGNISWASEDGVLYNKSKSLLHSYPGGKSGSFTIPSSVTEIATTAFYGCTNLSSVTIPNSVTTIGFGAFAYCNGLTSITIPNSVTAIGYAAFSVCERLMEINVADGNISWVSEDGVLYNKSKSVLRSCPGGKSRTFTIPSHVTEIDTSAFWGCTSLTSITIPNSVKTIGVAAFEECTSLTSVVIPNSVTTIREGAFNLCYGLTSVTIPKSVTAIGERAFAECPILTDVTVSWPTPLSINEHIFSTYYLSESNCTLHVPVGTKALYAAANVWKDFVTILEGDTGGDDDDEGEGDEGEGEGGDDDNGDDEGDNDDSVEAVNSNKAEVTLADGILTITSPAAEQVEVYALTGALLHKESKASGSLTLNIGHLPKGILIVRGNSGWTQKVILR
jgi:Flp pilus assembly protein protease CpaA